jgi:hypothetical protein
MTHPISMPAIQPSLAASIAISCAATRTSMCWVAAAARITDILSKSATRAGRPHHREAMAVPQPLSLGPRALAVMRAEAAVQG